MPHLWGNLHMMPLQVPYHFSTTSSEFNASVYVPVENPDNAGLA